MYGFKRINGSFKSYRIWFCLINVFSHKIIKRYAYKENIIMSYLLHLSDGSNLIAFQEPWTEYAPINDGHFGYRIPDKEKTNVYLKQFTVIKEPKEPSEEKIIEMNDEIYTEHNESLCSLIELKAHKIVTACFQGGFSIQMMSPINSSVQIFDNIKNINK